MIINAPESVPRWVRLRDGALTAAMWAAYLYLLSDVLEFVEALFDWLFRPEASLAPFPQTLRILVTLGSYTLVVVLNGVAFWGWSQYNRIRFRGAERRKPMAAVTTADIAERYGLQEADLARWQRSPILVIRHAADGRIVQIEAPPAAALV